MKNILNVHALILSSLNFLSDKEITAIICACLIIFVLLFLLRLLFKRRKQPRYKLKQRLMTATEERYYDMICAAVEGRLLVYPQINLASIIDKEGGGYRSELFRNVDFAVFDKDLHPLLLIEINDKSHLRKDRMARDQRVAEICKSAGIGLLTLWTRDNHTPEQVRRAVWQGLGGARRR